MGDDNLDDDDDDGLSVKQLPATQPKSKAASTSVKQPRGSKIKRPQGNNDDLEAM